MSSPDSIICSSLQSKVFAGILSFDFVANYLRTFLGRYDGEANDNINFHLFPIRYYYTNCYVCKAKAKPGTEYMHNYGGLVIIILSLLTFQDVFHLVIVT